ncbi:MAG: SDR family oxidoreductase [Candidatus Cloacimonetes bacterium]|nr:SDR family oxidoreductase [Candidatus Cloacimonadota bacterium]
MDNLFDLTNKVAIVTGGGSGLGRSNAIALAKAGAYVVITDIDYKNAQKVTKEIINLGGKSICIKVDVTKKQELQDMVRETVNVFNKVDILINSAGIIAPHAPHIPLVEMDEKKWDRVIEVNLKGTFLSNQAVAKQMIKQKSGRIINMASMSGTIVNRDILGVGTYCTSKAGVIIFTKALALELLKYNITVNSISPGYMDTKLGALNPEDYKNKLKMIPINRLGKPEELNGLIIYLASDNASFITGSNIIIDGGYTCW